MIHLKTILHPTDFSEHSRYALEMACALARDQAARVIVLHVLPRSLVETSIGSVSAVKEAHASEDTKAYRNEMKTQLESACQGASCAGVKPLLKEGDVAATIVRTAEEAPCDVIVMGTHGRSRIQESIMGSVAAEVTRTATCPVVAVKVPPTKC